MASKRRNMFYWNKKQETTEIGGRPTAASPPAASRKLKLETLAVWKTRAVTRVQSVDPEGVSPQKRLPDVAQASFRISPSGTSQTFLAGRSSQDTRWRHSMVVQLGEHEANVL
ncbi:hypothetical protein AAG570_005765 [Ranatra chinensis]|uniref:Uncharacterized protein n=1 Tax=Ranatra chinensis TaxID=642074 RepID=A0ABD0YM17_9HEMI